MSTPYLIRVAFTAPDGFPPTALRHIETLVSRTVRAFKDVTVQCVEAERACPCCDQFASLCPCEFLDHHRHCDYHGREVQP